MCGKISLRMVKMATAPSTSINTAMTTNEYGRRSASLTIHMNIYLANALGQAGASTNARDVFFPGMPASLDMEPGMMQTTYRGRLLAAAGMAFARLRSEMSRRGEPISFAPQLLLRQHRGPRL